ncbi:TetR/AcrR family transcriptional regulator [Mycolicibacterium elephantis]
MANRNGGRTSISDPGRAEDSQSDSRSDSKSALTKARILDAAAQVLSQKGYAGLRLTEVASRAEVRAPAIYYYASRDALIEEVMWAGIADMREHVTAALDQLPDDTPALERLLTAADAHLRHALKISDYTTASIRNAGQVPLSIRKRQILEEERYGEVFWRRLINDLAREGRLRPELDLYIAQMLVLGALNWAVEWWHPRRGSVEAVVANAQTLIRHGLAVNP